MYENITHIKAFPISFGHLAYTYLRNIYASLSIFNLVPYILDIQFLELLNSFNSDLSTLYQT